MLVFFYLSFIYLYIKFYLNLNIRSYLVFILCIFKLSVFFYLNIFFFLLFTLFISIVFLFFFVIKYSFYIYILCFHVYLGGGEEGKQEETAGNNVEFSCFSFVRSIIDKKYKIFIYLTLSFLQVFFCFHLDLFIFPF